MSVPDRRECPLCAVQWSLDFVAERFKQHENASVALFLRARMAAIIRRAAPLCEDHWQAQLRRRGIVRVE